MRFSNYIKNYSDFYLSKYTVTKKKFEDILKQKLKKDFFKKKISEEDYEMFIKQVDAVLDYYNKFGVFNEELIIKNKIQYCLRRGYSLTKVKHYLVKNRFHEELISKELKSLDSNSSLKKSLIERFIEKKIKLSKYKNSELTNSQIFDKLIKSLVQNGFDYECSKNILHRYLSKC